jgi:hypothetical protein
MAETRRTTSAQRMKVHRNRKRLGLGQRRYEAKTNRRRENAIKRVGNFTRSRYRHRQNRRRRPMSVDLMLPAAQKIVLMLEGIGDDKVRVNSSSLDHPLVIPLEQGIEIVAIEKKVTVGRLMR